jgi:hypothetical protein
VVANTVEIDRAIYEQALTGVVSLSPALRDRVVGKLDEAAADIERVRAARGGGPAPAGEPFGPPDSVTATRLQGLSLPDQLEAARRALIGIQPSLDFDEREQIAELLARAVNRHAGARSSRDDAVAALAAATMKAEGYCRFDRVIEPEAAAAVRDFLLPRPCYNAHVPSMSDNFTRRIGSGAEQFHYGSHSLSDIVRAPHLLELANSAALLDIAELYLGCVPTLYSLNAWWSFPVGSGPARYSQSFHRDRDDFRFCVLFVYLTDVDQEAGPHVYIRRTHRRDLIEKRLSDVRELAPALTDDEWRRMDAQVLSATEGYGSDRFLQTVFGEHSDVIVGQAGSAILADTYGFHKGVPPKAKPRLMFWARYGTYANFSPPTQRIPWSIAAGRLPSDARTRYVNRALFSD